MHLYAALLLAFCGVSTAWFETRCPPGFGKKNFDNERFSGDWYIVTKTSHKAVKTEDLVCGKVHYSATPMDNVTRVEMKVTLKHADGSETNMESRGQTYVPKMTSVTQAAFRKSGEENWKGVATHSIIATDYDQYAVSFVCKEYYNPKDDSFNKMALYSVLSRKPTLDSVVTETLKSVLIGLNNEAVSSMQTVDNSGC